MTRTEAEQLLILDCGPLLTAVGLTVAATGSDPTLGTVLARVMATVGYPCASPLGPTDAELAILAGQQLAWFNRAAVLECLKLADNRLTQSDIKSYDYEEKFSQLAERLRLRIKDAAAELAAMPFGFSNSPRIGRISAGVPVPHNPWTRSIRGIPVP